MFEYAVRLKKGDDLKEKIETICLEKSFDTVVVLSAVGCLEKINLRLAGARSYRIVEEDGEIVSLNGTIAKGEAHLHLSYSNDEGQCFGGHLKKGCIVNTTVELVLGILEAYESVREYDPATAYNEIVFKKRG